MPLHDDVTLRAVTEDLIADPPDVLIATTGIGFRHQRIVDDGEQVIETDAVVALHPRLFAFEAPAAQAAPQVEVEVMMADSQRICQPG